MDGLSKAFQLNQSEIYSRITEATTNGPSNGQIMGYPVSADGTVNYAALYSVVEREMAVPSKLLEHVAHRIIEAVKRDFPTVTGGEITISKLRPPFHCDLQSVDVTIAW